MAMYWAEKLLLIKSETDYGADPNPTEAADAILASDVKLSPMEGQDVSRELERTYMGAQPTVAAGLHSKITFKVEMKGSGTAGTAPAIAPIFNACAFVESVSGGEVIYTRLGRGADHGSATVYINIGGILYKMLGARGTAKLTVNAQGIAYLECEITGLFTMPEDQTPPTATYGSQLTLVPVVSTTENTPLFTIGGVQMVMNSFTLDFGNTVELRNWIGSDSVIISAITESVQTKIEAVPLATWNPYDLAKAGTTQVLRLTNGIEAGNIVDVGIDALQIQRPSTIDQTQGIVDWTIQGVPQPISGNDQLTITFR
ncbi:hypothetical protein D2T29_19625 [Sinirhodobacter populi]|uniref:Uncharacterized protein n=1 Tax=Paenirhodobacter populi TaxID=2306993 RepID=A0A443K1Z7_9RHOB|nr:phage tail tube protein [Sinirhodobacter populi]RWR26789.1 hypothetical protein D2T29_19625 [Sinirhodobacter populi]